MMYIITPSIRPDGLKMTFEALKGQTFKNYKWLPRLSIPGQKPDLCYQFNQAIQEVNMDFNAECIVFLQDYIDLPDPDTLQKIWDLHCSNDNDIAWTFSLGEGWDWRSEGERRSIPYHQWEIDFGMISCVRGMFYGTPFDEAFDDGFGWENVDLAYRLEKEFGVKFFVAPDIQARGVDHEPIEPHPYKHKPNQGKWLAKKALLDEYYGSN